MTFEIAYVLGVTLVAMFLFVRELVPPDATAILTLIALVVGGLLTPDMAFQSFGNEALVTVGAMFVLSAAITRTGAVGFVGRRILAHGGRNEVRVLLAVMIAAVVCSAFINNTPVAVIFLPMVLGIAGATGLSGSKLLIPMSYATIVGGMCTVIGTSTNILVSSVLPRFALDPLPLFTPLPLALLGIVMTLAYMALVGRRLLPNRPTVSSAVQQGKISEYVTELRIPGGSPLAGKSIANVIAALAPNARVLQLIRNDIIMPWSAERTTVREGDILIVKGDVNDFLNFQRKEGVEIVPDLAAPEVEARPRELTMAELLVRPTAPIIGSRVQELDLQQSFGATVLAVQRHGTHIRQKVGDVRLRFGDVLLIQGSAETLTKLRTSRDFIVVEGIDERLILSHKAWIALTVVACVIGLAAFKLVPVSILALGGAVILIGSGCIGVRDAYRAIDLPILMLMAGTIALGMAMDASGAAQWIASGLVHVARPLGDVALLSAIYLICNVLTAIASNAGAALITLPIALEIARQSEMSHVPFVLAIMFAASIDFSTPIGYQTNTFVYGPGGYRFLDYVKVGGPLNLMWWILATLLIPLFWPLRP